MLHGQPIGHPGFMDDWKTAKKSFLNIKVMSILCLMNQKDLIKKI